MDMQALRNRIDRIDTKILRLLKKRFKLSKQIRQIKVREGLKVEDKEREEELFRNLNKSAKKFNLDAGLVKQVYELILKESKRLQKNS